MVWGNVSPGAPSIVPQVSKPTIAIGIIHTEMISVQWAYQMFGPLIFVPVPWCVKVPLMSRGVPQSVARDLVVKMALADKKITHILWVDTDNCCVDNAKGDYMDPNVALETLYKLQVPIVSGLYRAKQQQGFNYAAWMNNPEPNSQGWVSIQSWSGNFFPVDVIGMGFCLVKREVYEKVPEPWFPWPTVSPSEDFNFCIAARKAGYAINLFTDVKLSHIGMLNVKPDGSVHTLEA